VGADVPQLGRSLRVRSREVAAHVGYMMPACLSQLLQYAPNGIIACRAPGLRLACGRTANYAGLPRVCGRSWRSAV